VKKARPLEISYKTVSGFTGKILEENMEIDPLDN
jgi:hypothetical protein